MNQKKFIIVLTVTAVSLITVVGGYFVFSNKLKPVSPPVFIENSNRSVTSEQAENQYNNVISFNTPKDWLSDSFETEFSERSFVLYSPGTIRFAAEILKKPISTITAEQLTFEQFAPDIDIAVVDKLNGKSPDTPSGIPIFYKDGKYIYDPKYVSDPIIKEFDVDGRHTTEYRTRINRDVPGGYVEGRRIVIDHEKFFITISGTPVFSEEINILLNSIKFFK